MILPGQFCFATIEKTGAIIYCEGMRQIDTRDGLMSLVRVHNLGFGATAEVNRKGDGHLNRTLDTIKVQSVIIAKKPPFNVRDVNAALAWYQSTRTAQILNGQKAPPRRV